MWSRSLVAALAVTMLAAPVSSGVQVLQDEPGDVQYRPVGPVGQDTPWQTADLLGLAVEESPTMLRFVLTVMPPSTVDVRSLQDGIEWVIHFRVGAVAYEVQVYDSPIAGTDDWVRAELRRYSGVGDYTPDRIGYLDATYSPGAGTIMVDVPRADLRDHDDVEITAQDLIANLWVDTRPAVFAISFGGSGPTYGPYDRMPDAGDEDYEIRLGARQSGDARLSTDERLRASNGAATTYFFDVNLTNLADYKDTYALALTDPPAAWSVRLPYDRVDVPANSTVRFPLLVTVPFQHAHGSIDTFLLSAASETDPDSVGRLEIGVEFLATPQPAGHHDTVFLHGNGIVANTLDTPAVYISTSRTLAWMNTLPDDPRAADAPTPAYRYSDGTALQERYGWVFPLDPTLRLGLDFDMDRVGSLLGRFSTGLDVSDAWLEGRLVAVPRGEVSTSPAAYDDLAGARVFAQIPPTNIGTVGQGTGFGVTVEPSREGDLVPPSRDENLVLILWLHGTRAPVPAGDMSTVFLEQGATMQLPLNEYHDPIDEAFSAPDFIHIDARGPVERFVAPGGAVLYELRLLNDGVRDGTFDVTAYGSNADWVTFPAGTTFVAPSTKPVTIPIAVRPPANADEGTSADVVIEAVAREDERMRGLIRLSAIVDSQRAQEADFDDTTEVLAIEEAQQKDSPGVALLAPFLLASVAALLRRRL